MININKLNKLIEIINATPVKTDPKTIEIIKNIEKELISKGFVNRNNPEKLSMKGIKILLEYLKEEKIEISGNKLAQILNVNSATINMLKKV